MDNQTSVRAIPCLGSFRKHGLLFVRSDAIFLHFLVCKADLDILCSGSFSNHVKFYSFVYSFVFMKKIPTRVVCVTGKHPCSSKTYFRLK